MDPENSQDSDSEEEVETREISMAELIQLMHPIPKPVIKDTPDKPYHECAELEHEEEEHAQMHFDQHVKKYHARLQEALLELQSAKKIAEENPSVEVPDEVTLPEDYKEVGVIYTETEVEEKQNIADFNYMMQESMRQNILKQVPPQMLALVQMLTGQMPEAINEVDSYEEELSSQATSSDADEDEEVMSTKAKIA